MMSFFQQIPLPARAALATIVAALAARLGFTVTESTAAAVVVAVLWALGGLAEFVAARRKGSQ